MSFPYFLDPVATVQLCERVFADTLPLYAHLVYLYGHTPANEADVLREGAKISSRYPGVELGLCGLAKSQLKPNDPFSGAEVWTEALTKIGVPRRAITWVKQELDPIPVPCTDTESFNLIRHAKGHDEKTVVIVTPVFHALRATISVVSAAMYLRAYDLHVFVRAVPQDMDQTVQNTQSTAPVARIEEARSEMEKIQDCAIVGGRTDRFTYLFSIEQVLDYFKRRGSS